MTVRIFYRWKKKSHVFLVTFTFLSFMLRAMQLLLILQSDDVALVLTRQPWCSWWCLVDSSYASVSLFSRCSKAAAAIRSLTRCLSLWWMSCRLVSLFLLCTIHPRLHPVRHEDPAACVSSLSPCWSSNKDGVKLALWSLSVFKHILLQINTPHEF